VVVAGAVLLIGGAHAPPRFVARAGFVVDWNTMPSVPSDEAAQKVRNDWRKFIISEVTSLPHSEQEISDLLDRAEGFDANQTDKPTLVSKLTRWLRVRLVSQTNDCDRFTIEMRDNDPKVAEAVANWVLRGTVSKLRTEASTGSGLAALRSTANVEDVDQKETDLKKELRELEDNHARPFDDDVEQRHRAIKAELNKLELEHVEAGFGFLPRRSLLSSLRWFQNEKIVSKPSPESVRHVHSRRPRRSC